MLSNMAGLGRKRNPYEFWKHLDQQVFVLGDGEKRYQPNTKIDSKFV
tara:strand:- start:29 stop:169 length:141 start_codon:yes stop_codon:yes gene_type:complete